MKAIIFALVGYLISALREYLPGIVGRILLALGIGLATQAIAMPAMLAFVQSKVDGMPEKIVGYFGALGMDVVCTLLFSALAARAAQRVLLKKIGG